MTKTVKDKVVKVTVLSAVTIVTFAGNAALIIPNSKVNAQQDTSISTELDNTSELFADEAISIDSDLAEILFDQYSSEGIRPKIERASKWKFNSDILEYLDITAVEAVNANQQGKTFRDIALDKDKSVEELANIFEDSLRYKLDKKLEDGNISYERYINMVNNLPSIRENFVNGVY
ncbi:hypothetical protein KC678_01365 [Candidatus Dojkabacteria bacterium]|uniref:Uncharacterized protein n=1 Tax=Candidatus Dojkabacteria bacterium TaxID=2099670 RepID=A0A955I9Q1_9BACT|nr:hypothetical protein [Candidatus Dojkabacteria bacterium]